MLTLIILDKASKTMTFIAGIYWHRYKVLINGQRNLKKEVISWCFYE